MLNIINPTIDLFLYDLRNSLSDNEKSIGEKREYFYQKFHETVQERLKEDGKDLDQRQKQEVGYIQLLKDIYAPLDPDTPIENGYYYPVRLGDSYGLLLEVAEVNGSQEKTPEYFAELKERIQRKLGDNKATLGQTWMLSTYLPNFSEITSAEIEQIAQESYKAIFPNTNIEEVKFHKKGEFIGATIFEYSDKGFKEEVVKLGEKENSIFVQNKHVIVAIYPDKESFDILSELYTDWMSLLYYHHKIIWAYGQGSVLINKAKEMFGKVYSITGSIEEKVTEGNGKVNRLEEIGSILRKVQVIMNQYTNNMNNLQFQKVTIQINLSNYEKRLKTISKNATEKVPGSRTNIDFLDDFSKLVKDKYLWQIKEDLESFELGLRLLENNINAIRSQTEIEKAKVDRDFKELITVVGIGVAIAGLTGDNAATECKSIFNDRFFLCQNTFVYNITLVFFVSLLIWLLRKYILKRS